MQNAPQGVNYSENEHCYTIDGDADRSLFFYSQVPPHFGTFFNLTFFFSIGFTFFLQSAGWCSGTAAHFPRRRLGVQIQSEAGSSGHQAVIGRGFH